MNEHVQIEKKRQINLGFKGYEPLKWPVGLKGLKHIRNTLEIHTDSRKILRELIFEDFEVFCLTSKILSTNSCQKSRNDS